MSAYRTDLAMERTPSGKAEAMEGVTVDSSREGSMEVTLVTIRDEQTAATIGKACGHYWTLTVPELPHMLPEDRIPVAARLAEALRELLPASGDVLVLGLGNRRLTADALGDRVVSGILVTRHLSEPGFRGVCALAPGVLGVTGMETAEMALALTKRLHPAAVIVVDALAAMETAHICTTVQVTDTGIRPGSGVGNHRAEISRDTLQVPVIAVGIPMVVYTSTIVRDALQLILSRESTQEEAETMAAQLTDGMQGEMIVTPRDIDETVQGLADMLALAINAALQPQCSMEELRLCLH